MDLRQHLGAGTTVVDTISGAGFVPLFAALQAAAFLSFGISASAWADRARCSVRNGASFGISGENRDIDR